MLKIVRNPDLIFDCVSCPVGVSYNSATYGFDLTGDSGEWEVSMRYSEGQDGKMRWAIVISQVDGGMTVRQGECPADDTPTVLRQALISMCTDLGWKDEYIRMW